MLNKSSREKVKNSDLHLSAEHELVEDEVGLLEVEDDVQLADGAEVLVQHLHVPKEA